MLFCGALIWTNRCDAYRIGKFNYTVDNRSGGYQKFPQSFFTNAGQNKFIHEFYYSHKHSEPLITNRNTCGTRSVVFNPKRSGKIIGGKFDGFYSINFANCNIF